MADFVFNNVLGKVRYYLELPAASDGLLLVLLQFTGLEADGALRDYDDLGALLAAASNEMTFTGYTRKAITPAAAVIDDVNNRADTDATDPTSYTNSGGASERSGKALLVYDGDTGAGTDANIIPLLGWDCDFTFDVGATSDLKFNVAGMVRAQG